MTVEFLDYKVFAGNVDQCADEMMAAIAGKTDACQTMVCLNPHSYVTARRDGDFDAALRSADWLVPDGSGILLGARILGLPIATRVSGPDVFAAVMEKLNRSGGSVFFLGSTEQTLAQVRQRMEETYPMVRLAGTYSPPFVAEFTAAQNDAMIEAVNSGHPDVLWVGMTAPKQEKWLMANRARLKVATAGAIGAAFDFFAGTVRRSPTGFRRAGLEWLPRLIQQPRRLWRRMFVSAPIFLADVLWARLSGKG